MIENYDDVDVFVGVDVGKSEHHAVALNRAGKVIFDKALPNDEAKMEAADYGSLSGDHLGNLSGAHLRLAG